jgi:hypothetical protein
MVLLSMAGMAIATLVALGYPLLSKRKLPAEEEADDELAQHKVSLFQDLSDLEFDRDIGKVAEGDYQLMRAGYESEAARVLEIMDRRGNGQASKQVCPQCGQRVVEADRFCGGCGQRFSRKRR